MFDTMTMTKALGALCGSLLILLLGAWAAESLYHVGGSGHGDHAQAYVIEVEGDDDHGAVEEEGPSLEELIASADLAKGAKAFSKCKACHKAEDGKNATGPYLYGVVDRAVGSVPDFSYSGSLVAVADIWTPENLDGFIENPKKFAPGTKMSFAGLKKPADRANLIAYLDSLDN